MRLAWKRRDWLSAVGAASTFGGSGLLAACGGGGDTPAEEPIAASLLATTAQNQAATYRHVDQLGPTREIRRGGQAMPLPIHRTSLNGLRYDFGGSSHTVDDYMSRNRTAGILILKRGEIALERYGMGNDARSRWTSFSVAKSVTSTLVGAALKDGSIRSLDDGVAQYVSPLRGSAYEQSSIRQLLRMTSGIRWVEDYSGAADSEITKFAQAVSSGKNGAVMDLMRTLPRAAAPGSVFNYSTGESYVLGAVVAAATGATLSDYLSRKIWAPLGMEAPGYWLLDSANGLELGGDNFSATLRDYARFGQFFMRGGIVNGSSVLPDRWMELAGHPESAVTACGALYPDYPLGYGYQWWSFPKGANAIPFHDSAFTAEGIFGQFIYINPLEDIVAAVWSAWPNAWIAAAEMETYSLLGTAAAMLR